MKTHYAFTLAQVVLLLISGLLLSYVITADGSAIHKALAGFFVGTYSMLAKEIVKLGIASFLRRSWPIFDSNKWSNLIIILTLVILCLAGGIAWVVSWEGSTGIWFGIAVFFAALLSDAGAAPLFNEFYPTGTASGA